MTYSFWEKRFPTLIGLFLIGISVVATVHLTQQPQTISTKATEAIRIEDLRISNQSPASVSISFRTTKSLPVQIRFGQNLQNGALLFDDRDAIGRQIGVHKNHYFTVKNLTAGTTYFFTIVSGTQTLDKDGHGYTVSTAFGALGDQRFTEGQPTDHGPVVGTAVDASGKALTDAIVFIKIDGAALISTLVKAEGKFLVSITPLYTADLTGLYRLKGFETITIEVLGDDGGGATGVVALGQQGNIAPIVLGKKDNQSSSGFAIGDSPLAPENPAGQTIATPKDGDFVVDSRPLIKGKATPLQKIQLTIQSDTPREVEITSDANGDWVYQPDVSLSPGKHTVSARFFQGENVVKTIKNQFEVFASGLQVSDSATPSPTLRLQPTSTPTPLPTVAPMPKTGVALPGLLFGGAGLLTVAFGVLAFFVF